MDKSYVPQFNPSSRRQYDDEQQGGTGQGSSSGAQPGTENWTNTAGSQGAHGGQSWNPPMQNVDNTLMGWNGGQGAFDTSKPPPRIDQPRAKSQILKHLGNPVMVPPTATGFSEAQPRAPVYSGPPPPIYNVQQPYPNNGGDNFRQGQGRPILGRKPPPSQEPTYSHTDYQMFNAAEMTTVAPATPPPISTQSNLNVTASEFVPKSFTPQPAFEQSAAAMGHWSNNDYSTEQPEITPAPINEANFSTNYTEEPAAGAEGIQDLIDAIITVVQNDVQKLRVDPGSFDLIKLTVRESFYAIIDSSENPSDKMKILVELIVLPALEEDNFAYSCARLCSFLSDNVFLNENDKIFRRHLLQRLKSEHDDWQVFLEQNDLKSLTNYTFFLAELYLQLPIEGANKKIDRFEKFQDALLEIINGLFSKPSDANLNLAGRLLKVCGGALMEDEANRGMNRLEGVMKMCEHFSVSGTVSDGTRAILHQVLKIKPNNREAELSQSAAVGSNIPISSDSDAPVIFGPDGQVLTEDELNFLEENFVPNGQNELQYEDADEDEIDEAYEVFLRSQMSRK